MRALLLVLLVVVHQALGSIQGLTCDHVQKACFLWPGNINPKTQKAVTLTEYLESLPSLLSMNKYTVYVHPCDSETCSDFTTCTTRPTGTCTTKHHYQVTETIEAVPNIQIESMIAGNLFHIVTTVSPALILSDQSGLRDVKILSATNTIRGLIHYVGSDYAGTVLCRGCTGITDQATPTAYPDDMTFLHITGGGNAQQLQVDLDGATIKDSDASLGILANVTGFRGIFTIEGTCSGTVFYKPAINFATIVTSGYIPQGHLVVATGQPQLLSHETISDADLEAIFLAQSDSDITADDSDDDPKTPWVTYIIVGLLFATILFLTVFSVYHLTRGHEHKVTMKKKQ